LLSYGDGAGHEGQCDDKSWDFWDATLELIIMCDDVTGRRCNECCDVIATDFGDGGLGLIDDCEDVMSPSSYPPSTLLSVLLSLGEFNDP